MHKKVCPMVKPGNPTPTNFFWLHLWLIATNNFSMKRIFSCTAAMQGAYIDSSNLTNATHRMEFWINLNGVSRNRFGFLLDVLLLTPQSCNRLTEPAVLLVSKYTHTYIIYKYILYRNIYI